MSEASAVVERTIETVDGKVVIENLTESEIAELEAFVITVNARAEAVQELEDDFAAGNVPAHHYELGKEHNLSAIVPSHEHTDRYAELAVLAEAGLLEKLTSAGSEVPPELKEFGESLAELLFGKPGESGEPEPSEHDGEAEGDRISVAVSGDLSEIETQAFGSLMEVIANRRNAAILAETTEARDKIEASVIEVSIKE